MSEGKRLSIKLNGLEIAVAGETVTKEQKANFELAQQISDMDVAKEQPVDNFKKVSKEDFEAFVNNYPAKLVYDVTGICEPPLGTYNDFSNGKVWPESVVARVDLYNGSDYHNFKTPEYFILKTQND